MSSQMGIHTKIAVRLIRITKKKMHNKHANKHTENFVSLILEYIYDGIKIFIFQ